MKIHDVDQNTDEWMALRAGKPTASAFNQIITSKGEPSTSLKKYAMQLAGGLYAGEPLDSWEGDKYTERGHEVEAEAVDYYELINGPTDQIGFITDDLERYGCSPDRLVGADGLLEIKCLPKLHIEALLYYKKTKGIPTKHVAQVQGQLLVSERKWVDVLYYHSDLPKIIIRIEPDKEFIKKLQGQLALVLSERVKIFNTLRELS